MSIEFSNAYQEILVENAVAIIKQNFLFQTQLKLAEKNGKEKEELAKRNSELVLECEKLRNELKQLNVYKTKADSNNNLQEEKNRIQMALNDEMKKNANLKVDIDKLKREILSNKNSSDKEIMELKLQNEKLQELVPVSKLKKIGLDVADDSAKITNNIKKIQDGSSF
jgi:predicted nuclease with TOPRIM domain